jgi:hypothetical protein
LRTVRTCSGEELPLEDLFIHSGSLRIGEEKESGVVFHRRSHEKCDFRALFEDF